MLDGVFARGTTPTHIFPLPGTLTMADLIDFTVSYKQKRKPPTIVKHKKDACQIDEIDKNKYIVIVLSQSDTLKFVPEQNIVEVQVKGMTTGSDVIMIGDYRFRLEDCYDESEFDLK